ncbi:hypothetical protein [Ligilactobacillus animalis]|uniref:hypothetical protein n=1 Tax=Ligilactobacillus animalis TaxID=1605 RepID=UPI002FD971C5
MARIDQRYGYSNYQTINVNGAITASSNGNIGSNGHNVTVQVNHVMLAQVKLNWVKTRPLTLLVVTGSS